MSEETNQNCDKDISKIMEKEWDLSWEHINNVSKTYWALFLSIVTFNGFLIKHYLEKQTDYSIIDGIISIFVLIINFIIILIYQREHYAQDENYFSIHLIRNTILKQNSSWNHFYNKMIDDNYKINFNKLDGFGFRYYIIFKMLFLLIPIFIYIQFYDNTCNECTKYIILILNILLGIIFFIIFNYCRLKGEENKKKFIEKLKSKS